MENPEKRLSPVSETLFIPLYCRAMETKQTNPIVRDNEAVAITEQLDPGFAASGSRLFRTLAGRKLARKLTITMALRTRKFDAYVRDFAARHDHPVFVNMGCGLDTRFKRLDDGHMVWFDLDLPEMIDLRRQFFNESDRYHMIASSVLNFSWIDGLAGLEERPVMFLAEGLFMYLTEDGVRDLLLRLLKAFPGSELVCEVTNSYWVKRMKSRYIKWKFRRQLHLDEKAAFTFGIGDSHDMERWNSDIAFLDEWTYFDDNEPKLGWLNWFRNFEMFRKVQWTAHYRLGPGPQ